MKLILTRAAKLLLPMAVLAIRILLNEGLTDLETTVRAVLGKAARRFLAAHPEGA